MDVVFNLDIPEDDDPSQVGDEFWGKYNGCVIEIRGNCSANQLYHGFQITSYEHDPPLANLILELLDDNEDLIVVTIKYERSSVYFVAWRRGRGEPQPNNHQNNEPWRKCSGFSDIDIPGSIPAGFHGRYGGDNDETTLLGISEFGIQSLRQAVFNLWRGNQVEKNFLSLCVHIAEPVRYRCVADQIRDVVTVNVYYPINFDQMVKLFIKNWQVVSNAIQDHFESEDPNHEFAIPKQGLAHLTIDDARLIMGIIKRRKIIDVGN